MTEELAKLRQAAEQVAQRENCFLYDLELVGSGGRRILRVFIDKDGQEGVSIDDCSNVSRGLDLVLDVENLVPGGAYTLEVSSPGLDRHLNQDWHFEKATGETISVQLNKGLGEFIEKPSKKDEKRKKLVGKLLSFQDGNIQVEGEDGSVEIPTQFIHKARVVFSPEVNFSNKKPKGRKG